MEKNENGTVKANVKFTITENGEIEVTEHVFTGTEEEVEAKIDALNEDKSDSKVNIKKTIKTIKEKE